MTGSQVLVIGGAGFLGQAIIDQLLERGDIVSTFDLRSANRPNVNSIIGNINNPGDVRDALQDIDTVIHCASPIHGKPSAIYFKVNVDGTQVVLDMCKEMRVKKLVFTSSASVTYNGNDLFNMDETIPYCDIHMDAYNETKAIAEEMVLNANSETLYTCSIRPSGIFGPKDSQGSLAIVEAAKKGQYKVVIGSNSSLFDLTYVDNVAYAHILAMEKLDDPSVQGEAFLITNDEPILFWDYPKLLLHHLGYRNTQRIMLPTIVGIILAMVMEFIAYFTGGHPLLTRFRIKIINSNRYFNISKAKSLLGYSPLVSLVDGIKRTADYWREQGFAFETVNK